MMFTWYFLAPVGIFLALFYKESFPNGLWFYVRAHQRIIEMLCHVFQGHIGVMIATIVFNFIGLILILVHADGKWIQTVKDFTHPAPVQSIFLQDDNQVHQILGIICIAAPCINVSLAQMFGNCTPILAYR